MKRNFIAWCALTLCPLTALASDHDFNAAVASIEHNYHVHRQYIPMMGLMSFCARVGTGGAVKGIKIAAFEEGSTLPADSDMPALLKDALGSSWSLVVESRGRGTADKAGEQDAIYARPHGERMTLLVASYDSGELSVVRVDLDAKQFAKWMDDPVRHARNHETN